MSIQICACFQGIKDWQYSSVQYWQMFFPCLSHMHTLFDQLRKYHFVPVCHGLMWNIENILAFCTRNLYKLQLVQILALYKLQLPY